MVKTKVILIIVLALMLFPLVASAPPFQTSGSGGLEIKYPQTDVIKQGQGIAYHTHVYNMSTGLLVTNATTTCNIHLYNSSGSHVLESDMEFDNNGKDFKLDIDGGVFATAQRMSAIVYCNSSTEGGFVSFGFDVNSTGQELTDARSILYIGLLAILIFMFIIDLGGITLLPSGDIKTDEGEILAVNNLKYLRPVLWVVAYMLLLAILFISSNVALAYLGTALIGNVLFVMFQIMGWLIIPMIIIWTLYIFVGIFKDKETRSMLERGIPVERL